MNQLPVGVSVDDKYNGQGDGLESLNSTLNCDKSANFFALGLGAQHVKVGGFVIDIEQITNEGLIKMRKLLP